MKKIYTYGDDFTFIVFDYFDDDYVMDNNQTETIMPDGLYTPIKFDETGNRWIGQSFEEFQKGNPTNLSSAKSSAELISDLTKQLAMAQMNQAKTNAGLLQKNATLVKQVVDLQSEKEITNG